MKKRFLWGILAGILFAYVILPDPLPVIADDVLAAAGGAASALLASGLFSSSGK